MHYRTFGDTGLTVSALGFGAGHIGDPSMDEDHVGTLINRAVDRGINLIDTARGYGSSEERVGRHLSWRRRDYLLSTKVGYGVEGVRDWTGESVWRGLEDSMSRMQTDHIEIAHLHSCPVETLQTSGVVEALVDAKAQALIGLIAYSGDNDALEWALADPRIDSVQCSLNPFDQSASAMVEEYPHKGVVAKRPLGNAPWRFTNHPGSHYAAVYWERMMAMGIEPELFELGWGELALRFSVFHAGAHTAIVGTGSIEHLEQNVEIASRGPLHEETARAVKLAFEEHGKGWSGEV